MFRSRLKVVAALLMLPIMAALALAGCGGSDSESAFTPAPTVRFVGTGLQVNPGESTALAVALDIRAPKKTSVQLLGLQYPDGAFIVPTSVDVASRDSFAVFEVMAQDAAQGGDRLELSIVPGAAYRVGTPSSVVVTVVARPLPELSLVGPDQTVDPGAGFTYNV